MGTKIRMSVFAVAISLVGGIVASGCNGDSGSAATQQYTKTATDGKLPPALGGLKGGFSRGGGKPRMFGGGQAAGGAATAQ